VQLFLFGIISGINTERDMNCLSEFNYNFSSTIEWLESSNKSRYLYSTPVLNNTSSGISHSFWINYINGDLGAFAIFGYNVSNHPSSIAKWDCS